jgi:hypothetical protein
MGQSSNLHQSPEHPSTLAFAALNLTAQSPGETGPSQQDSAYYYAKTSDDAPSLHAVDQYAPSNYPGLCQHPACLGRSKKQKLYSNQKDWSDHNKRTHNKGHICRLDNCREGGMAFGTANDLKRHHHAYHHVPTTQVFVCDIPNCQGLSHTFKRPDKFKDHNTKWHGPYICSVPECVRGAGHGFPDAPALNKHLAEKHGYHQYSY